MAGFDLMRMLNSNTIENNVQEPEREGKTFEIEMLDVEDLMPSSDNFYDVSNIKELSDSIELAGGVKQNLVVKPLAHGKYEIIAGHRRRAACMELVKEGKEEYRKVPCRIEHQSDDIKDKLTLILTNASARQLTDWEKVQQAKELKEILIEYKEALKAENEGKPKEEQVRIGRVRDIIAKMLDTSPTQIGRMEAIDNNLSEDFKEELKSGAIGISTAHELSKLDEESQAEAYEEYEEKGEIHIKDVKPKRSAEPDESDYKALYEELGYDVDCDEWMITEHQLKTNFKHTMSSTSKIKFDGSPEGITINDKKRVSWAKLSEEFMKIFTSVRCEDAAEEYIEEDTYEYSPEKNYMPGSVLDESASEECCGNAAEPEEEIESFVSESDTIEIEPETDPEERTGKQIEGQMEITDPEYKKYLPEVKEKDMRFFRWVIERYGFQHCLKMQDVMEEAIKMVMAEEDNEEFMDAFKHGKIPFFQMCAVATQAICKWEYELIDDYKKYIKG